MLELAMSHFDRNYLQRRAPTQTLHGRIVELKPFGLRFVDEQLGEMWVPASALDFDAVSEDDDTIDVDLNWLRRRRSGAH